MHRRDYLASAAATGAAASAGCLGVLGGGDGSPDVALAEPDRKYDSADLPYLAWGERVPDVTIPAPLDDRTVALRDVDAPAVMTFFYSHCQTVCPVLVSALRNVQTRAKAAGYADDVAFLPVTFDPERDDADRLLAYADRMNVDADAPTWHFLRPSPARVESVVEGDFGVTFDRTNTDGDGYMFTHTPLVTLVNADGYVERAYRTKTPDTGQILEDLATVRDA